MSKMKDLHLGLTMGTSRVQIFVWKAAVFSGLISFTQFLETNFRTVPEIKPKHLVSKSLPIRYSLIILSFLESVITLGLL